MYHFNAGRKTVLPNPCNKKVKCSYESFVKMRFNNQTAVLYCCFNILFYRVRLQTEIFLVSAADITHPLLNLCSLFTLHRRLVSPPVSHLYLAQKVWRVVCSRQNAVKLIERRQQQTKKKRREENFTCKSKSDAVTFQILNLETANGDKTTRKKSIIAPTNFILFCAIMSYDTVSVIVSMLGHSHVMGRGSGIRSIKTTAQETSLIPRLNEQNNLCFSSGSTGVSLEIHPLRLSQDSTQQTRPIYV